MVLRENLSKYLRDRRAAFWSLVSAEMRRCDDAEPTYGFIVRSAKTTHPPVGRGSGGSLTAHGRVAAAADHLRKSMYYLVEWRRAATRSRH
ncbi:hypothetical protein [Amycolatopsis sp. cmx-11-51]|uniref:hypothetical protein n=1 Tax=Amycolatopsis sp. cmx-11-51 TaxID=2785797 RepID=UPI0039E5F4DE